MALSHETYGYVYPNNAEHTHMHIVPVPRTRRKIAPVDAFINCRLSHYQPQPHSHSHQQLSNFGLYNEIRQRQHANSNGTNVIAPKLNSTNQNVLKIVQKPNISASEPAVIAIARPAQTVPTPSATKPKAQWQPHRAALSMPSLNGIPRRLRDFVFRRNTENQVYRSESFRFIQKTNPLESPFGPGISRYRSQRFGLGVGVRDDYVEPVDYLVKESRPAESSGEDQTKNEVKEENQETEVDEVSEKEISYNAPYYYSDTLSQEPTYCSPYQSVPPNDPPSGGAEVSTVVCDKRKGVEGESRWCADSSLQMARKRYETAFLPSGHHHHGVQSPDVDCLLMAIQSTTLSDGDEATRGAPTPIRLSSDVPKYSTSTYASTTRDLEKSFKDHGNSSHLVEQKLYVSNFSNVSPEFHDKRQKDDSESIDVGAHCLPRKVITTLPLSEPLPKRFSVSSRSNSDAMSRCDKRVMLTIAKDSMSSLESLDSTKSEGFQPLSLYAGSCGETNRRLRGGPSKCAHLSPISDKSPLETASMVHAVDVKDISESYIPKDWSRNTNLLTTAELTNVPWEMPKLRRRLALLADSGISLDFSNRDMDSQFPCTSTGDLGRDLFQEKLFSRDGTGDRAKPNALAIPDDGHLDMRLSPDNGNELELSCVELNAPQEYYMKKLDEDFEYVENSQQLTLPTLENKMTHSQSFLANASSKDRDNFGRPDRCHMKLDFGNWKGNSNVKYEFDPNIELEMQDWFHGSITRVEAESILRSTKEGSFLIRNCESSTFNRYSLSLKSSRGCIHIRIEPNSLGTFSLGEQEFPSVPHLVLHFMSHRLPIKGAEHIKLLHPVITQLL